MQQQLRVRTNRQQPTAEDELVLEPVEVSGNQDVVVPEVRQLGQGDSVPGARVHAWGERDL